MNIEVTAPTAEHPGSSTFTESVTVGKVNELLAFDIQLTFDGDVVTPIEVTSPIGFDTVHNVLGNVLLIASYSAYPWSGDGPVLDITFDSSDSGKTELIPSQANFFGMEGMMTVTTNDGLITLV